ncbi:MAG: hypothetical protein EBZ91_13320 [Gammaproteobacteria bacterium]|nr:hypothetical protein [Gammaproteobacteria bacterium]
MLVVVLVVLSMELVVLADSEQELVTQLLLAILTLLQSVLGVLLVIFRVEEPMGHRLYLQIQQTHQQI